MQQPRRPHALQERQRLRVATGNDVLTVVDALAGPRIAEGVGTAAEGGTCFEQVHRYTGFGERRRGGKAGEPSADHDDWRLAHDAFDLMCETGSRRPASVRAQVVSAIIRRAGRGTRTTRVNTS
jgi:hypothetical protein